MITQMKGRNEYKKRRQKKFHITTKHLLIILPSLRLFKKPITKSINSYNKSLCMYHLSVTYVDICLTVITLKGQGKKWGYIGINLLYFTEI